MRAVIQRVSRASVAVAGETVGAIDRGLLVLLGIAQSDTSADASWLAAKICALRIFEDDAGKMNLAVRDVAGGVLVVSQFTLHASTRKGTRPSFNHAASPELAIPLYEAFIGQVNEALGCPAAAGRFGAMMEVALVNDGPVTIVIDTVSKE